MCFCPTVKVSWPKNKPSSDNCLVLIAKCQRPVCGLHRHPFWAFLKLLINRARYDLTWECNPAIARYLLFTSLLQGISCLLGFLILHRLEFEPILAFQLDEGINLYCSFNSQGWNELSCCGFPKHFLSCTPTIKWNELLCFLKASLLPEDFKSVLFVKFWFVIF